MFITHKREREEEKKTHKKVNSAFFPHLYIELNDAPDTPNHTHTYTFSHFIHKNMCVERTKNKRRIAFHTLVICSLFTINKWK